MDKKTRSLWALLLTLLVMLYPACGVWAAKQPDAKLKMDADRTKVYVGETLQLHITCDDPEVSLDGLLFTSGNKKCAEVSETGVLTALKQGRVKVTAHTADKKRSATMTLQVEVMPETLTITAKKTSVITGKKIKAAATVLPKAAKDRAVTWQSSDEAIATVSTRGEIYGISPGKAFITASCTHFPAVLASVEIEVIRLATQLALSAEGSSVIVGETIPLFCQFEPEDVSGWEVTYKSNHPKIATVDENGIVTGVKAGKATIRATAKDGSKKSDKIVVQVIQPLHGVHITKDEVNISVGASKSFTAELEPKNATNKNMTWASDDPSVATVEGTTNKFKVRVHSWGEAVITGTTQEGGYTASLYVQGGLEREAVKIFRCFTDSRGRLRMALRNESNMEIGAVNIALKGMDGNGEPVVMSDASAPLPQWEDGGIEPCDSPKGRYAFSKDPLICDSIIYEDLRPGAEVESGWGLLVRPTSFDGLETIYVAITGYICLDGYRCDISQNQWKWIEVQ